MNWLNLILSGLVTSIGITFSLKCLSEKRVPIKNIIISIILLTIFISLGMNYYYGFPKILSFLIMSILICYMYIFNKNLDESIFYNIIYFILSSIIDIILSFILMLTIKYTINDYNNFEYSLLLFSILNTIFVYFVISRKRFKKIISSFKSNIYNKTIKIYTFSCVIVLLLLSINNFINYENHFNYYINIIMTIFVILISVIFIKNTISKIKIETKYKEMMDYVSKYEKIINEQGKKNHEFNNQLMVLSGYINNKKRLKEYLASIINENKGGKNYTIEQLSYFPDGGIKGIIYHKLIKMEEYNIKPFLYIDKESKNIFESKFDIKMYSDITKLFGVYIDNAIEAAKDAKVKEVEIDMKIDNDYLIITIGNTYDENIDLGKIGKKGFSTKGKGHGFGLSLVKDISRCNEKIETITDINNNMFKQIILIDLK